MGDGTRAGEAAVFRRGAEDLLRASRAGLWLKIYLCKILQLGDVTLDRVPMDGVVGRPLLARRAVSDELPSVLDEKVGGLLLSR